MACGTVHQLLCAGDPQPAVFFNTKPDKAGYFIIPCPYLVILELALACLLGKTEADIGGILLALFGNQVILHTSKCKNLCHNTPFCHWPYYL